MLRFPSPIKYDNFQKIIIINMNGEKWRGHISTHNYWGSRGLSRGL